MPDGRLIARIPDPETIERLFEDLADQYADRPGRLYENSSRGRAPWRRCPSGPHGVGVSEARTVRATVEYGRCGFSGIPAAAQCSHGAGCTGIRHFGGHRNCWTVAGAGRTDSGVHALGQVIACRVATYLDDATLLKALNAHLPADVAIRDLTTADPEFDSATRRHDKGLRVPSRAAPGATPRWTGTVRGTLRSRWMWPGCAARRPDSSALTTLTPFTARSPDEYRARDLRARSLARRLHHLHRHSPQVRFCTVWCDESSRRSCASVGERLTWLPLEHSCGLLPARMFVERLPRNGLTLVRVEYSGLAPRYNQQCTKQAVMT